MNAKELKKLRRSDLLEMLLVLRKENDQLRQQLELAQKQLQDRQIKMEESGSLAEAVLRLNGVFEAAQEACDQYAENIRQRMAQQEQETKEKCEQMLADAKKQMKTYSWLTEVMKDTDSL